MNVVIASLLLEEKNLLQDNSLFCKIVIQQAKNRGSDFCILSKGYFTVSLSKPVDRE